MESRSGRRRRSSLRQLGSPGGISALPDDLLLLILARLGCFLAAARTGVVSRRWRGLWASLRHIVFRDIPFPSLQAALGRMSRPPPGLSLLEIRVAKQREHVPELHVHSLFRAAAQLEPDELVFDLHYNLCGPKVCLYLDVPSFHRTTSIVLILRCQSLRVPAGVELPALETLSLSGCTVDVNAFISRCPSLRTLRLTDVCFRAARDCDPRVNSASLQELVITHSTIGIAAVVYGVHIVAPVLKKLTLSLNLWTATINVLAPMLEKVSWRCHLYGPGTKFGWRLMQLNLHKTTPQTKGLLQLHACHSSDITYNGEATITTQNIEKHMIAKFSVLEIRLTTKGHVFGPLVADLLGMNRICSSVHRLKVVLERSEDEEKCPLDCPCDSPSWRSQTRSLTTLEEVEINGFEGDQHEIDFLKLMFTCAPILKRMVVKLSDEASSTNFGRRKIYHIFRVWSSIDFHVHSTSDEYIFQRLD